MKTRFQLNLEKLCILNEYAEQIRHALALSVKGAK